MDIAIYISEGSMLLAEGVYKKGRLQVRRAVRTEAPETIYHEGLLADPAQLASRIRAALDGAGIKSKRARIVVDGSTSAVKEMQLPKYRRKDLDKLVVNEMRQVLNLELDYVVDYMIKGQVEEDGHTFYQIAATAMLKTLAEQYREVAKLAGLKAVSLDITQNTLTRLSEMVISDKAPHIVIDLHHGTVITLLLAGGRLVLSRSSKLVAANQPDNYQQSMQMATQQAISKLIQFYKYQNPDAPIRKVYFTGDYIDHPEALEEAGVIFDVQTAYLSLSDHLDERSDVKDISRYCLGLGALISDRKQHIDLFDGLLASPKRDRSQENVGLFKVLAVLLALSAVGIGAASGYFLWLDKELDVEIEALSTQINDPQLQHNAELATINQLNLQEELDLITDLQESLAILDSQPALEETVFETIKRTKPQGSRFVSMTYENGVLTVTAKSKARLDPYQYAKDLTESGEFYKVDYYGFESDVSSDYEYSVLCTLKGGAVHEAE